MLSEVKLGNITLQTPVWNAGGSCKTWKDFLALCQTRIGAIEFGSVTAGAREGNPGHVLHVAIGNSLNSIGLRNEGIEHHRREIPNMVRRAHEHEKPFLLNIAGFSTQEYLELATMGAESGVDGLVVNLSCPNTERDRVICSTPDLVYQILSRIRAMPAALNLAIIPKISPCEPPLLKELAEVLIETKVTGVAAVNSFPNCYDCDELGQPIISPNYGLAGGAGGMLFLIGMGNVHQLEFLLPPEIAIIGIGGISSGVHAWKYLKAGATAVALHTAARNPSPPHELNPQVFNQIIDGLERKIAAVEYAEQMARS